MDLPLLLGSICFWESFGERSEFAEKPTAHLSRKVEAKVISCRRFTRVPLGRQAAFLSYLEEMRIDLKLVPSEKVCWLPEPVHVVKDAFGLWYTEEVTHDDLLSRK